MFVARMSISSLVFLLRNFLIGTVHFSICTVLGDSMARRRPAVRDVRRPPELAMHIEWVRRADRLQSTVRPSAPPVDDRRRFHPLGDLRPPGALRKSARKLVGFKDFRLRFAVPELVVPCIKRKIRREVIFAKKLRKKGSGGSRRRNIWSEIKC